MTHMALDNTITGLFCEGNPCSRIDRMLCLRSGTAKRCVIRWWADDRLAARTIGETGDGSEEPDDE